MKITIGTRKSQLALVQTNAVRTALLAAHPGLTVEIEHITTRGDQILDRPLSHIGDKGLFVTEIEEALRAGRIDLAVHSAKDLPSVLPDDMTIAAYPQRADPRDVLISRSGQPLAELPAQARIGTSSPRRACQIASLRPDLAIVDIRGNVDTRLRKLQEGQYDAIVLAAAGLERLGLLAHVSEFFDPQTFIPAVSQGTLAIEARANDQRIAELVGPLDDPDARSSASAEKAVLARIGGGCQVAVGAYAHHDRSTLLLTAMIGAPDGRLVRAALAGTIDTAANLGRVLADQLLSVGGRELLQIAEA